MNGAIYVEGSENSKLGTKSKKIDCTYASINATCSNSCPLRNSSCYAQTSYVGITVARLNKEAKDLNSVKVARAEAKVINESHKGGEIPTGRDLRLHVSGDARTLSSARIIARAAEKWKARGGNKVFTYTHSWRNVPRSIWKSVSILASIESVKYVKEARKQGYAPALVVPEHTTDKAYYIKGSDVKWIPCPAQTRDNVNCVTCRLCFDADKLFERNCGITFAAHGVNKVSLKKHLKVIR